MRSCSACGGAVSATAKFCEHCGAALFTAAGATNAADPSTGVRERSDVAPSHGSDMPARSSLAERRQVTVMFCDIVGSTKIAAALDPEDWRELLAEFRERTTAVIKRSGGFAARYIGDSLLTYFGYPVAHEDDAERAVRAGLQQVREIRELDSPVPLEARVGIATGVVVVGDLIGEGASREEVAIGATVHLAARLQALAAPGSVAISAETRKLTRDAFEYVDLGEHNLKGFDKPVRAYGVVDERPLTTRAGSRATPLFGRGAELGLLNDAWNAAEGGNGRVVVITGEPGIGKSRLVQALRDDAGGRDHAFLQYYCAQRFQNTALFPVIAQLERAAGLVPTDTPVEKLNKVAALFPGLPPAEVPYVASLLSVPYEPHYPRITASPERQKERTFEILIDQVRKLASERLVVMLCEDLHWADASTRELIAKLTETIASRRVLLIITTRDETDAAAAPHVSTLTLRRLEAEHAASLMSYLTLGQRLAPDLLDQVMKKSDGIPLFIEELTRFVIETPSGDGQGSGGAPGTHAVTVPSTLQDSLLARLDRLGRAKEIAHVGAVIGRQFSYRLLSSLLGADEFQLRPALQRLKEADLIESAGEPPAATYTFRHALIQDAAYATMLRGERRALHGRVGELLEREFPEVAENQPELVAHHFTEAASESKAIPYWHRAGLRAASRAANQEACAHFRYGLGLLGKLPEGEGRYRLELGLQVQLGLSLSASLGYAAPDVAAAYERARAICNVLGASADLYSVLRGLSTFYIVRDDLAVARELAEECVRLGDESRVPEHIIDGVTALGYVLTYLGKFKEGRAQLERAVEVYRANEGPRRTYPSAQDPAVASLCLAAHVALIQGDAPAAEALRNEALETAAATKRPFDLAYAHCFTAMFDNIKGDFASAERHADTTIQISQEHGFNVWLGAGTMQRAIARVELGHAPESAAVLSYMLDLWQKSGAELNRPYFLAGLASGLRLAGDPASALQRIGEALEHAARHNERFYEAELHRLRGELLATSAGVNAREAERELREAVRIADEQGGGLFAARAKHALEKLPVPA